MMQSRGPFRRLGIRVYCSHLPFHKIFACSCHKYFARLSFSNNCQYLKPAVVVFKQTLVFNLNQFSRKWKANKSHSNRSNKPFDIFYRTSQTLTANKKGCLLRGASREGKQKCNKLCARKSTSQPMNSSYVQCCFSFLETLNIKCITFQAIDFLQVEHFCEWEIQFMEYYQ